MNTTHTLTRCDADTICRKLDRCAMNGVNPTRLIRSLARSYPVMTLDFIMSQVGSLRPSEIAAAYLKGRA